MSDPIPLSIPSLTGNEAPYIHECLETNLVSSVGPFVRRFEQAFADFVGAQHAVACTSGTAALHVALRVAGAEAGATVATSTFTFIASANAIAYTGATPLFVDSERHTWNLDCEVLHGEIIRRAASGRTIPKIIEPVHVLGHPADLEPLLDLRERFGILIVEDAAESLGATYSKRRGAGRHVGTIGDLGCYSFNGNKIITTGGGGMIVTDDTDLAGRARHLTTQAKLPGLEYIHDEIGYNYRLTNIAAALGLAQLEALPSHLDAKRRNAARYADLLRDLPLQLAPDASWARPSFWLYSVLLEEGAPRRDEVLDRLHEAGVLARPLWRPLHKQGPYSGTRLFGGRIAEDLYAHGISLPSSVNLSNDEIERVALTLRGALRT